MLTRNQFAVIEALRRNGDVTSQSRLAGLSGLSVGTVNSTLRELRDRRWVDAAGFRVTEAGMRQLEPYKVENAVIMAAGFSSHFAPVSYERPKGLLTVRGEVLIERQIRQLKEAGIDDITVVVGYMKELFFYLGEKFGVRIAVNDEYATRDNHGSLYLVRERLDNTYICSSDNYFSENVFEPYVYESYYAGVYSDGPTDEWCMQSKSHDVICDVTVGGEDSWYMLGQAYFDREFSKRFRAILEEEYGLPATRKKLWEAIFAEHLAELRMVLRRYPEGVIHEFDSIEDMQEFDPGFIDNVDSRILDNIVSVLGCSRADVTGIEPIKAGYNNLSCKFEAKGAWYVYRHPGENARKLVNHASEAFSEGVAEGIGIDDTFVHEDPAEGWKISRYMDGCTPFDPHDAQQVDQAMGMLRTLHGCGVRSDWECGMSKTGFLVQTLDDLSRTSYPDFKELRGDVEAVRALVREDGIEPCLCHGNFYESSILLHDGRMDLIDWEYSGMGDYAFDLGTFVCCSADYGHEEVLGVLRAYFQREPDAAELRHCLAYVALAAFHWFVWALYMETCGEPVGEMVYTWYRLAREYSHRVLSM